MLDTANIYTQVVDAIDGRAYSIDRSDERRHKMSKINTTAAKESWIKAGLNAQGTAAINAWIDKLAVSVEAGHGRWDAYAKFAIYEGFDPMGSVGLLKDAVEQTSK
jgi:hypothetical protein